MTVPVSQVVTVNQGLDDALQPRDPDTQRREKQHFRKGWTTDNVQCVMRATLQQAPAAQGVQSLSQKRPVADDHKHKTTGRLLYTVFQD